MRRALLPQAPLLSMPTDVEPIDCTDCMPIVYVFKWLWQANESAGLPRKKMQPCPTLDAHTPTEGSADAVPFSGMTCTITAEPLFLNSCAYVRIFEHEGNMYSEVVGDISFRRGS